MAATMLRHWAVRRRGLVGLGFAVLLLAGLSFAALPGRPLNLITAGLNPLALQSTHNAPGKKPVQEQHLVVLGDSVASGAGCGCAPFARLLATALAGGSGRGVAMINAAQDGLTSQGLVDQLGSQNLARSLAAASLVTVTIGANDFNQDLASHPHCLAPAVETCYGAQLAGLGLRLSATLARIRSLAPASRIFVTGYWNVFLDGDVGSQLGSTYVQVSDLLTRTVNAEISRRATSAGVTYVDLYQAFRRRTASALTALLAADGDHPSARGHQLISDLLLQTIRSGVGAPS